MTKNIKTAALLAVLSLMAVGCQKETIVESNTGLQATVRVRTVTFTIDGVTQQTVFKSDQSWMEFLRQLTALAKQGHSVHFRCEETRTNASAAKDVVTFETPDENEAIAWCNTMVDKGYEVYMYYDKESGKFICVAEN